MGGSSDQVTGYKYVTNFLLFIGNPIEKVLGINFDKRGWLTPLIDEMKNPLSVGVVEKPTLYGENEGGVVGQIYAKYGTDNQQVVPFYKWTETSLAFRNRFFIKPTDGCIFFLFCMNDLNGLIILAAWFKRINGMCRYNFTRRIHNSDFHTRANAGV